MPRPRALLLVVVFCFLVSLFCVAYPIYVIRPFRAQGPAELAAALFITRYRVGVAIVSALVSTGLLIQLFRGHASRSNRIVAAVTTALVVAMVFLSRVNVYEIMFHPMGQLTFTPAATAALDKDEKVLAIKIGNTARAYPIRGLSYHHIANDIIDNVAIVATY